MKSAITFAKSNGNKIHRHPGGFWASEQWPTTSRLHFGTSTIHALVERGLAEYSSWKEGKNGRFPIEIKLTPEGERHERI